MDPRWMIYGAYGYTGDLIAREAKRLAMPPPLLAGRNPEPLKALADELGFAAKSFSLDDASAVAREIEGLDLVLHCAGPFSATAKPMMTACLEQGVHYLDITGEIEVFELAQSLDAKARERGVVLCPGVGFDVIPTDCVAACLKEALPDATRLMLAFTSGSRMSPGTAKTSVEGMGKGGKIRRNGKIVTVPIGTPFRKIDFGEGAQETVRIPWGDVSTAYHTTGIPDIEVYMGISPAMKGQLKMMRWLRWLLAIGPVARLAKRRIDQSLRGPQESERIVYGSLVYGEVGNAAGKTVRAHLKTANGYTVTTDGSLAVVRHLLENEATPGAHTPSGLMGARFIESLSGSEPIEIG